MRSNHLSRALPAMLALATLTTSSGCRMVAGFRHHILGLGADTPRLAPAKQDLVGVSTIAVARLDGRPMDVNAVSGALGQALSQSGRFQVVERERLQTIATERGCTELDMACYASALPASAMIVGTISPTTYDEHMERSSYECKQNNRKAVCTNYTRKGTVRGAANLRVVDTATGKVLFQAMLNKTANDTQVGANEQPPAIDALALAEQVRGQLADEFFREISPHYVNERIALHRNGDVPELSIGNDHVKAGRIDEAVSAYELALKTAASHSGVDAGERAEVHYSLGFSQALSGKYDAAIQNIQKAQQLDDDRDYVEMLMRVRQWQTDAERVTRQLASALPDATATLGMVGARDPS